MNSFYFTVAAHWKLFERVNYFSTSKYLNTIRLARERTQGQAGAAGWGAPHGMVNVRKRSKKNALVVCEKQTLVEGFGENLKGLYNEKVSLEISSNSES